MSKMIVNVEFLAGTSIIDAVMDAKEKVLLWDVGLVKFKFSGVNVVVGRKQTNREDISDLWYDALKNKKTYLSL